MGMGDSSQWRLSPHRAVHRISAMFASHGLQPAGLRKSSQTERELGRRPSRAFCRAPASRMSERLLVGIRPKALSSITSSPKPTLTPQHGQTPWTPYAELQAEACHTVACSRLLCTAQTELELGDVCRIQPALGHRSSDTNPLPCYPSGMLGGPKIKDVASAISASAR